MLKWNVEMEGEGLPIALVGFERTMQDVRLVVLAAAGGFGYLPGISPTPESAPPSASLASRRRNFGPILVFGSVRGRMPPVPRPTKMGRPLPLQKVARSPVIIDIAEYIRTANPPTCVLGLRSWGSI